MSLDLKTAEPQIRALARALKWERREVVEALEAHASIPEPAHQPIERRPSPVVQPVESRFAPVPKDNPRRSEPYRRWVASLPCMNCGVEGFSNACHSDADGKGAWIKAPDDTCYPGCVDRPGVVGCHTLIGATGKMGKEGRRELETVYADATRRMARATGNWPKEWD